MPNETKKGEKIDGEDHGVVVVVAVVAVVVVVVDDRETQARKSQNLRAKSHSAGSVSLAVK